MYRDWVLCQDGGAGKNNKKRSSPEIRRLASLAASPDWPQPPVPDQPAALLGRGPDYMPNEKLAWGEFRDTQGQLKYSQFVYGQSLEPPAGPMVVSQQ